MAFSEPGREVDLHNEINLHVEAKAVEIVAKLQPPLRTAHPLDPKRSMTCDTRKPHQIDAAQLPDGFPTHRHPPEFWEALGRTVATFGFLEEILGKAIFALTATRSVTEGQEEAELEAWLTKLERALSDALGGLIDSYGKALRTHPQSVATNPEDLIEDLRKAAVLRNVLCHGSWGTPDALGRSRPFFVNRQVEEFQGDVDVAYLNQVREHVAGLICAVIDTVTYMGLQFPGSNGPGIALFGSPRAAGGHTGDGGQG